MTLGTFGSFVSVGGSRSHQWLRQLSCQATSYKSDVAVKQLRKQEWNFAVDPMNILLFVMLGLFVFMMFRRNKKTKEQQAALQSKVVPGVDVMTSFGLFGHIISIDEEENKVVLELSPGNLATVHRQAVTKVVEPVLESPAVPNDASSLTPEASENSAPSSETPAETLKRLTDEGKKDS